MEVVDEYAAKSESDGKRLGMVMISYCIIKGVNDTDECARQLTNLLRGRPVTVNLIPYNPFEGNAHGYESPTAERFDSFCQLLCKADIRVFERRHHGRDINAACGQLAKLSGVPAADIENCSGELLVEEAVAARAA